MARILNKMYDVLFILLVTGFLVWIANMEAGSTAFSKSAIGIILMVVITAIGVLISMLPGFKRLPMVFWVSTCAVVASLPAFPLSAEILSYTKEVGFLPITTRFSLTRASRSARTWKASSTSRGASCPWRLPLLPATSSARRRSPK